LSPTICKFCDTDFVGVDGTLGAKYTDAVALAATVASLWPSPDLANRFVVLTGGEPLLQIDGALIDALHGQGFDIAVETNGTIRAPAGIDWICVSPKAGAPLVQTRGQELKLVFPQPGLLPGAVQHLAFEHFLLQPMDGPMQAKNTDAARAFCQANPTWRLSVQIHKMIGIR
jgi:7-carboxy-7-deazaguanine synthase